MSPQTQFDKYARSYDRALNSALSATGETAEYFAEARMSLLLSLVQRYCPRQIRSVLDFGCGTGSATPFFHRFLTGAAVIGVDVSCESIQLAKNKFSDAEFHVLGSAGADSVSGVDLVFVNGVFHHIPPGERGDWLTWIHQRLVPGGVLALYENNPWNPGTRYIMSQCEFDEDAICLSPLEARARIDAAGFHVQTIRHLLFFPRYLRFMRVLEPYMGWIPLGGQYVCLGRKNLRLQ